MASQISSLPDGLIQSIDFLVAQALVDIPPFRHGPGIRIAGGIGLRNIGTDNADDELLVLGKPLTDHVLEHSPVVGVDIGNVANHFLHVGIVDPSSEPEQSNVSASA
jgi:hypothetical protein